MLNFKVYPLRGRETYLELSSGSLYRLVTLGLKVGSSLLETLVLR